MKNKIQILDKPNSHVETQVYNKEEKRISKIMALDGKYLVEFFKMGSGGQYVREMPTYNSETYACAFMAAKKYALTGETTQSQSFLVEVQS